jgi:hypothetical protein
MQHYYPYIILMFLGVVVFFITLGLLLRGKKKVPPPFSLPMEHIEDKSSEIINVTQTSSIQSTQDAVETNTQTTKLVPEVLDGLSQQDVQEFRLKQIPKMGNEIDDIKSRLDIIENILAEQYRHILNTPLTPIVESPEVEKVTSPGPAIDLFPQQTLGILPAPLSDAAAEVIETQSESPKVSGKLMNPRLHCYRCKHNWDQRGDTKPKHCPACHSTLWNKRVK